MLNVLLIMLCLGFMAFLSPRWVTMTTEMAEENRQKRILKHLDWQPKPKEEAAPKARRRR